jgi:hypothetical protein
MLLVDDRIGGFRGEMCMCGVRFSSLGFSSALNDDNGILCHAR